MKPGTGRTTQGRKLTLGFVSNQELSVRSLPKTQQDDPNQAWPHEQHLTGDSQRMDGKGSTRGFWQLQGPEERGERQ